MARELYKTDIETLMFNSLKENNINFVSEFPIRSKHGYILDFAIPDLKIDIECDGSNWHIKGNSRDNKRNWVLRNKGWIVIRFTEEEIKTNIQSCISKIQDTITRRLNQNGES